MYEKTILLVLEAASFLSERAVNVWNSLPKMSISDVIEVVFVLLNIQICRFF